MQNLFPQNFWSFSKDFAHSPNFMLYFWVSIRFFWPISTLLSNQVTYQIGQPASTCQIYYWKLNLLSNLSAKFLLTKALKFCFTNFNFVKPLDNYYTTILQLCMCMCKVAYICDMYTRTTCTLPYIQICFFNDVSKRQHSKKGNFVSSSPGLLERDFGYS